MPKFDQIAIKIIKEQELVVGPLAWSEAKKVQGLQVIDDKNGQVSFNDSDQKGVINRLVDQYSKLFGKASREVCREAAASLIANLSPQEVPSSLE